MFSRLKTSAILLLVIIPFLSTVASSSQQATTSTTTAFVTQRTLFSRDITVNQTGRFTCFQYSAPLTFTADHGDRIMGSFTSDRLVSFYVISNSLAISWGSGKGLVSSCTPSGTKDDVLVAEPDVTSLSIAFTINNPGSYRFVFVNFNRSNDVHINFNAGIVGS